MQILPVGILSEMRLITIIAALASLLAAAAAQAAPKSINATYDVTLNGLRVARMAERFEASEGRYRAESESTPVGLFVLFQPRPARFLSLGRVTERGLEPDHFEGSRGADDRRRVVADFDWQAQRITLERDGAKDSFALPAGAQDRLSMMYQFMMLGYDGVSQLEFTMTNGRKIDRYRYAVTPDVVIDTPLGRMTTLHLVKQRQPGDTVTEIWIAPQHAYLPVKMLVVEDGTRYEQIVTAIEVKP
jgi:hypothetical protein